MSEDNVTSIDKNQSKDPKTSALNKIKEASTKEWNTKIEAQVKKTLDAKKVYKNEHAALITLINDSEEAKVEYAELVKDL